MKALVWFRNDLRIHDNPILNGAMVSDKVIAVYCFDPQYFENGAFGFKKTERFRAKFLIESIQNLRKNLAELNITLFVFSERPEHILPDLVENYEIDALYFQKEWTRDENQVLKKIKNRLADDVACHSFYGQFLFHPDDIPYPSFHEIPKTFTSFRKKLEANTTVRKMVDDLTPKQDANFVGEGGDIPTLKELGLEAFKVDPRAVLEFKGGEDAALEQLHYYVWETKNIADYKKTRNGLLGADYSSKFSPWLANGSISPKMIYWQIKKFEEQIIQNSSTYWLIFELIWRDYFKYVSLKHGNDIFKIGGILNKDYDWDRDAETIEKWIQGRTEEPFVNANMMEIAKTGWMSNRGRQNVASYLAKELKIDWRIGASYFESMLIDYDVHSNWGNWMYVSGVGNDPRDRKFNIKKQAETYDPEGKFREHWLSQ